MERVYLDENCFKVARKKVESFKPGKTGIKSYASLRGLALSLDRQGVSVGRSQVRLVTQGMLRSIVKSGPFSVDVRLREGEDHASLFDRFERQFLERMDAAVDKGRFAELAAKLRDLALRFARMRGREIRSLILRCGPTDSENRGKFHPDSGGEYLSYLFIGPGTWFLLGDRIIQLPSRTYAVHRSGVLHASPDTARNRFFLRIGLAEE